MRCHALSDVGVHYTWKLRRCPAWAYWPYCSALTGACGLWY